MILLPWRAYRRRILVKLKCICLAAVVYLVVWTTIFVDDEMVQKEIRDVKLRYFSTMNKSFIKFVPLPRNDRIDNLTYDNVDLYPCRRPEAQPPAAVEDLMCQPRPKYLSSFKNPCFRGEDGKLLCLPYYNILGFDKSGTTDLSARMRAHPSILDADAYLGKEVYYWAWRRYGIFNYKKIRIICLNEYIFNFRTAASIIEKTEGQPTQPIVGDGGPNDAWDFRGAIFEPQNEDSSELKVLHIHVMRHILENPKFILMMRNPIDRLYSDYYFFGGNKSSPEKFHKHASEAVELMNACLRENATLQCFSSDDLYHRMIVRLQIGCYSLYLREWLAVFNRKHFLFMRTEDYARDTKKYLQDTFNFLGVETLSETAMDEILNKNRTLEGSKKKTRGPMLKETRQMLHDFYAPCNAHLAELLEDDRFLWEDS